MTATSLTSQQFEAPANASVTCTPTLGAYGNSAWSELIASTDAAIILSGIMLCPTGDFTSPFTAIEVDIGKGAAGLETVVATLRFQVGYQTSGGQVGGKYYHTTLMPGVDNIATATRVAARIRYGGSGGGLADTPWRVGITYYKKPLTGDYLVTSNVPICLPSASDSTAVAGTPAWSNGNWVQLRGASGPALMISSIAAYLSNGFTQYEVDIGVGGSGLETVVSTQKWNNITGFSIVDIVRFPNPLNVVALNQRIAVRARSSFPGGSVMVSLNCVPS